MANYKAARALLGKGRNAGEGAAGLSRNGCAATAGLSKNSGKKGTREPAGKKAKPKK
ncbi:MAG: hypothetical protein ABIS03_01410 [Gemmatimonadaceae bacterium]